jgi:rifampin ADP-ribosylating transferase
MSKQALFNFIVAKGDRSIMVERSFAAPLDLVWSAWTDPAILCRWWAPAPYRCIIKSLDFREGGKWLYCMEGPQGDRHWCYFQYETITPKSHFTGHDAFCSEEGVANAMKPATHWRNHFSAHEGGTLVRIHMSFDSSEALEQIIQMGFREGFTMGLEQLEEIFANTTFYHGTKSDLRVGDLIEPGFNSNYGQQKTAKYVYLTATLDAATWGAELAQGEGRGRIYIVEPTGHFENDPNLTDTKFPGNPTRSYRTKAALRVVGEVTEWQGHPPEQLQAMKAHLARLKEQGIEAIEN